MPYRASNAPASASRSVMSDGLPVRCQKSDREWYGRPATILAISASVIPFTSASDNRMP